MPLERVKNVVAFSFQHAPLGELLLTSLATLPNFLTTYKEILETSMIAWPNPAMWRQAPYNSSLIAQQVSPQRSYDEVETHSHSPRRKEPSRPAFIAPTFPNMLPPQIPGIPSFSRMSSHDPFFPSGSGFRKASSSSGDVSMPDYISYHLSHQGSHAKNSRSVTDSSHGDRNESKQQKDLQSAGAYEQICEALSIPAAPSNTPMNNVTPIAEMKTTGHLAQPFDELMEGEYQIHEQIPEGISKRAVTDQQVDHPEIDPSLRGSLFGEIKGKKEMLDSPRPMENPFISTEGSSRKTSQLFATTNVGGSNKRQRVVTPSFRGLIDENETEQARVSSSGSPRKVSITLNGIENIR